MRRIIVIFGMLFIAGTIFCVSPTQAQAFTFPIFPNFRSFFLRPTPTPQPLHWQQLDREQKLEQLDVAKERVVGQIEKAHVIMLRLEKRPFSAEKASEIDTFLSQQQDVIRATTTPEELESIAKETQQQWKEDKKTLQEMLQKSTWRKFSL